MVTINSYMEVLVGDSGCLAQDAAHMRPPMGSKPVVTHVAGRSWQRGVASQPTCGWQVLIPLEVVGGSRRRRVAMMLAEGQP